MSYMSTLLIANRGEIAGRIIRTAKRLGIRTIAIYTEPDSAAQHVAQSDEAHLLEGDATLAYLDGDQIIAIAKATGAQAIIPGYGFLSENMSFARDVASNGILFVGPDPGSIECFGLKHRARDLAVSAGVPVVPGTEGLLGSEEEAIQAAGGLGYPVMLKATAGGGGMGLLTCSDEDEVRNAFKTVQSRGEALFKNAGLFMERYYPSSHHIEVQVFGNGQGKVISLGERECSIQRRHQKVMEECPSPLVELKKPGLRKELTSAAVRLAESVNYASAGTIEYLVDDETGNFFFLEMNTRLQVEHGITEMCYDVDIVELMLRQADAQIPGKGGLTATELDDLQARCLEPKGHAIEVRVYAENPVRNYAPSPGLLQEVRWHEIPSGTTRIDTWVQAGITVSSNYDPLLAKVMHHAPTRQQTVEELAEIVGKSSICGPPTNLDFLHAITQDEKFRVGDTITKYLDTFEFAPPAIDVLSGGSYTLIQDFPGRPTIGRGFGHAGPMDPVAFQIANALVGNPLGKEGLEITLTGPDLLFLGDAIVALCGAPIQATLDCDEISMWSQTSIKAGQRLSVGKTLSNSGCRSYLAVYGGFLNVAEWFGSKATCPMVQVGGYQGRQLRSGDLLKIASANVLPKVTSGVVMPATAIPQYSAHWDVQVMPGPYEDGYLLDEHVDTFYDTTFEVSHNAARGGIRLIGPKPKWARADGGDGGAHPSNVIEYGYPMGGLNWTGDEPVIFPVDCPDFGGFVCSLTVVKADYWKVGQMCAGNTVKFHRVSLEHALKCRRAHDDFIDRVAKAVCKGTFDAVTPFASHSIAKPAGARSQEVVKVLKETSSRPLVSYRQGADDYLLVDYGYGSFDLNHKCRTTALNRALRSHATGKFSFTKDGGLLSTVGCGNSLMIYYNGLLIPQAELLSHLITLEAKLGDLSFAILANRIFHLPLTFTHRKLTESIERYMANQRPYASYLPDTFKFVADNNGISVSRLKEIYLEAEFVVIGVGFFMALPEALPADPRHRLNAPKMNPSRTFTPEGTASWGGSCLAVYPVDSPGGYMPTGMTIPGVDVLGYKSGFSPAQPWLFEDMDVIRFYEVTEAEYDGEMALFRSGRYEYRIEESGFDMREHNRLLEATREEVQGMRERQGRVQGEMVRLEQELLDRWAEEKKEGKVSMDYVQALLDDPNIEAIEAPVNANVWKVLVSEGETLKKHHVVTILEAMKMEINVLADDRMVGSTVEKVLIAPNDIVQSGKPLVLVRR
ncbi:putative urea amidolyase [Pseudomassariella vexata]|uniref:Putative urea amidolyase n=1 Tax=Pseudomassariella vexata TaxID=1141098 RepID=A0A1Y2D8U0_9PEZI|nr:putative urea amidolyase [Pseudomassariella vexata]ORY55683.1 putative urea amidolyase [Pseudomassariella vexata]